MTRIERAPSGLEYKSPAALMEPRPMPGGRPPQPPPDSGAARVDPDTGEFTALVAVTGVLDEVGDILEPGCFRSSLRTRTPRVCRGHDWQRVIGRAVEVVELMPGDPRLPRRTPKGDPWPPEAGALYVRARYVSTSDAQEARAIATAFGPDQGYSIGYKVKHARQRGAVRHINDLDLFEFSPVLHGANLLAHQLDVKHGHPVGLEYKSPSGVTARIVGDRRAVSRAIGSAAAKRGGAEQVVCCEACGAPAALVPGGLPPGRVLICVDCVNSASLDDLAEPPPTAEEEFTAALRDDRRMYLDANGRLRRGLRG